MLQSMGSQRVAHDLMAEQQQEQHTIRSSNVLTSVSSMPDIYHQKKKKMLSRKIRLETTKWKAFTDFEMKGSL